MDESFIMLFPILIVVVGALLFSSMMKAVRQTKQNRTWDEPEPEQKAPVQPAKPKHPPIQQGFSTFEPVHETDRQGWDSYAEFHEGEDPCHDDMKTVAVQAAQSAPSGLRLSVNELAKGFVIGEILNRKKR